MKKAVIYRFNALCKNTVSNLAELYDEYLYHNYDDEKLMHLVFVSFIIK